MSPLWFKRIGRVLCCSELIPKPPLPLAGSLCHCDPPSFGTNSTACFTSHQCNARQWFKNKAQRLKARETYRLITWVLHSLGHERLRKQQIKRKQATMSFCRLMELLVLTQNTCSESERVVCEQVHVNVCMILLHHYVKYCICFLAVLSSLWPWGFWIKSVRFIDISLLSVSATQSCGVSLELPDVSCLAIQVHCPPSIAARESCHFAWSKGLERRSTRRTTCRTTCTNKLGKKKWNLFTVEQRLSTSTASNNF